MTTTRTFDELYEQLSIRDRYNEMDYLSETCWDQAVELVETDPALAALWESLHYPAAEEKRNELIKQEAIRIYLAGRH